MSTNKTENLNLHAWTYDDPVKMDEFNENFAAIDAKAGEVDDAILATAEMVNACAHVAVGSYIGTGGFGLAHPNSITFDFAPKLVLLRPESGNWTTVIFRSCNSFYVRLSNSYYGNSVTWSADGKTVSWYYGGDDTDYSMMQANYSSYTYQWVAIG